MSPRSVGGCRRTLRPHATLLGLPATVDASVGDDDPDDLRRSWRVVLVGRTDAGCSRRSPLARSLRRRRSPGGAGAARQVHPLDVLVEHPRRREPPERRAPSTGASSSTQVAGRPSASPLVVARHDLLLEDPVEVLGVGPVLGRLVRVRLAAADRPAVVAGPALVPPAVEDADVDDAVRRGLHAARPRRLERPARVVEPDVDAGDEIAGDPDVVVLEDEDPAAQLLGA